MWWLLLACTDEPWEREEQVLDLDENAGLPEAPWAPIWIEGELCTTIEFDHRRFQDGPCEPIDQDRGNCMPESTSCEELDELEPIVEGPEPVRLVPHTDPNSGDQDIWYAEYGFEPGDWELLGARTPDGREHLLHEPLPFTIHEGTQPPAGTWQLERLEGASGLGPALEDILEVWLVLDEPAEDSVGFELIAELSGEERCLFLTGEAELVQGELWWEHEGMEANSDPPIASHEMWLSALFLEDESLVGGEAHLLADMRHWKADPDTERACELLEGFGVACEAPCPDGELECLDVHLHSMTARPSAHVDSSELPACGVDVSIPEAPQWNCDFEMPDFELNLCSTAGVLSVSWPAALLAFALLRRRRQD